MSRSVWKGPYAYTNLKTKKTSLNSNTLEISRNSEILPKCVGLSFRVHNGKNFANVLVTEQMVGHKFGEFSFTRVKFIFKKKK